MNTLLVVGAGPAGLAAAASAREAGARVVILDSSDWVGGQYWRHLPTSRPARNEALLHHGWSTFRNLRERLENDALCEVVTSAHVWAVEGTSLHVLVGEPDGVDREQRTLGADAIVFATGAHDRALPIPGWELPGVFTLGAAQALAKGERIAVGERVVVAGAGPFLLPVSSTLSRAGASVLGVFEATGARKLASEWLTRPWELVSAAGKVKELAGYVATHVQNRTPYVTGHGVTAIHGSDKVEAVTVSVLDASWAPVPGRDRVLEADAVCIGHGFTPRLELAIAAGCRLTVKRFVEVDENQETSIPGVFAAGEITGIGGVDLALAEGTIAGCIAAGAEAPHDALRRARARRRTFRRFAARIEFAHGIGENWSAWLSAETTVCRCEEVTFGRLCSVGEATQSEGLRSMKLVTRAGLGICQARVCGRTVEELLTRRGPLAELLEGDFTDRRPIAMPIRVGELAAKPEAPESIA